MTFKEWFNTHKDDPKIAALLSALPKKQVFDALNLVYAAGHTAGWGHAQEEIEDDR